MDGFTKRTETKRRAILDAAVRLMAVKQSRFTVSELARAASVSPVSIYNYFGSKEQVIIAVLTEMTEEQMGWIESQIADHVPFDQLLIEILSRKIETAGLFDETITTMIQADASWQQLAGRGYAAFRQLIEYGKTSGAIDPELSTDSYLRYVQLVQQAILSDPSLSTSPMTDSMQDYFRFFLHGIIRKHN
jgi:AcrR family transcriptional regulator